VKKKFNILLKREIYKINNNQDIKDKRCTFELYIYIYIMKNVGCKGHLTDTQNRFEGFEIQLLFDCMC
jgi:hypothetical protein